MIGAVKRSGDTIIGSLVVHDGSNYRNIAVKRDRPGGEVGEIRLEVDSAAGGNVYVTRTINNEISGRLTLRDNAILFNSNTIWHAGNDGAGSGLDADTVRGYIPANKAGDNFTGNINITITGSGDRGIDFGNSPKTAGAIGIFPGWGDRLYINIHSASGAKAVTRSSGVEIGGPVYVEGVNKVWHAGNLPIEYGTFTPQFRYGPPASSTPGDTTYSYQVGRYQRIGDRVFFDLYVKLSSRDPSWGGDQCDLYGLPYVPRNDNMLKKAAVDAKTRGLSANSPRSSLDFLRILPFSCTEVVPKGTLGTASFHFRGILIKSLKTKTITEQAGA
jgi:hypothetical protein